VERSDGRLAKVSYLFGVPESTETTPSEPAPSD
jgi:hypothetical protein